MKISVKKVVTVLLDFALAIYLILAFTVFNKPKDTFLVCSKVNIEVEDGAVGGFINSGEIKKRLVNKGLYPYEQPLTHIDVRKIEEALEHSAFVKKAECYKTQQGHVFISVTQRLPVVRIKSENGEDYYIDDQNCIMPNSHYTSDLIIATGKMSKNFAKNYVAPVSKVLMSNPLWLNLVEQINILPDKGIEIVPRIGDHIVLLGRLPYSNNKEKRTELITNFVEKKMERLEKFYKYGLNQAGWNKYSYINLEFDNQIICKKKNRNDKQL